MNKLTLQFVSRQFEEAFFLMERTKYKSILRAGAATNICQCILLAVYSIQKNKSSITQYSTEIAFIVLACFSQALIYFLKKNNNLINSLLLLKSILACLIIGASQIAQTEDNPEGSSPLLGFLLAFEIHCSTQGTNFLLKATGCLINLIVYNVMYFSSDSYGLVGAWSIGMLLYLLRTYVHDRSKRKQFAGEQHSSELSGFVDQVLPTSLIVAKYVLKEERCYWFSSNKRAQEKYSINCTDSFKEFAKKVIINRTITTQTNNHHQMNPDETPSDQDESMSSLPNKSQVFQQHSMHLKSQHLHHHHQTLLSYLESQAKQTFIKSTQRKSDLSNNNQSQHIPKTNSFGKLENINSNANTPHSNKMLTSISQKREQSRLFSLKQEKSSHFRTNAARKTLQPTDLEDQRKKEFQSHTCNTVQEGEQVRKISKLKIPSIPLRDAYWSAASLTKEKQTRFESADDATPQKIAKNSQFSTRLKHHSNNNNNNNTSFDKINATPKSEKMRPMPFQRTSKRASTTKLDLSRLNSIVENRPSSMRIEPRVTLPKEPRTQRSSPVINKIIEPKTIIIDDGSISGVYCDSEGRKKRLRISIHMFEAAEHFQVILIQDETLEAQLKYQTEVNKLLGSVLNEALSASRLPLAKGLFKLSHALDIAQKHSTQDKNGLFHHYSSCTCNSNNNNLHSAHCHSNQHGNQYFNFLDHAQSLVHIKMESVPLLANHELTAQQGMQNSKFLNSPNPSFSHTLPNTVSNLQNIPSWITLAAGKNINNNINNEQHKELDNEDSYKYPIQQLSQLQNISQNINISHSEYSPKYKILADDCIESLEGGRYQGFIALNSLYNYIDYLSILQHKPLDVRSSEISMCRILNDILGVVSGEAKKKQIQLVILNELTDDKLQSDERRFKQALLNILSFFFDRVSSPAYITLKVSGQPKSEMVKITILVTPQNSHLKDVLNTACKHFSYSKLPSLVTMEDIHQAATQIKYLQNIVTAQIIGKIGPYCKINTSWSNSSSGSLMLSFSIFRDLNILTQGEQQSNKPKTFYENQMEASNRFLTSFHNSRHASTAHHTHHFLPQKEEEDVPSDTSSQQLSQALNKVILSAFTAQTNKNQQVPLEQLNQNDTMLEYASKNTSNTNNNNANELLLHVYNSSQTNTASAISNNIFMFGDPAPSASNKSYQMNSFNQFNNISTTNFNISDQPPIVEPQFRSARSRSASARSSELAAQANSNTNNNVNGNPMIIYQQSRFEGRNRQKSFASKQISERMVSSDYDSSEVSSRKSSSTQQLELKKHQLKREELPFTIYEYTSKKTIKQQPQQDHLNITKMTLDSKKKVQINNNEHDTDENYSSFRLRNDTGVPSSSKEAVSFFTQPAPKQNY